MPAQPPEPLGARIPTLRFYAGQVVGRVLPKRHPRSNANVAPPELMAALALTDLSTAWKIQRNRFYRSVGWRDLRAATRTAAAGRCARCGVAALHDGHCHHKARLRTNWALRLDPHNVEWLCPMCHRREHGIGP